MPQDIQWFPGHMKKALRSISEQLKLVDLIIETADARIPFSSRNPELDSIIQVKPRILVLNKADLADPTVTKNWIDHFSSSGIPVIPCGVTDQRGLNQIRQTCKILCKDILEKSRAKGRTGRSIRAMVVGIPNSGKSTLINRLCSRKIAVTGDRPGVTRGYQWVRTDREIELMDMPGVLWPKIEGQKSQLGLTLTGAIKTDILDTVEVAVQGISLLMHLYPALLFERYNIVDAENIDHPKDAYEIFLSAAKNRGCILSGGRVDEERFSRMFLDDFQGGRIGYITLERPI